MLMGASAHAQGENDGKIIVEITKEVDGEKKTFRGEYESTEEMYADPNYQDFAGDEHSFNFWFDEDADRDIFLHLDQLKGHNRSFFRMFDDEEDAKDSHFFFEQLDGDSTSGFFNFHMDGDMEDLQEHMRELRKGMDLMFEEMDKNGRVRVIEIKRIRVTDVANEFGKKGQVEKADQLELEDLRFYPNPSSNGKLKLRFTVPEENELAIRISNLEGKAVYNRYFESFSGMYSEMIDLSDQKEGIYLLEIMQDKKRLTRKIIIN